MKENWVVLLAAGLYVAFLAYVGGAMSVVGVTNEMPFGVVEFWLNRYQTLLAASFAVAAVIAAFAQINEQKKIHRMTLAAKFSPELKSLRFAKDMAIQVRKELDLSRDNDWKDPIGSIAPQTIAIVSEHANATVRGAFELLTIGITAFNANPDGRSELDHNLKVATEMVIQLSDANSKSIMKMING